MLLPSDVARLVLGYLQEEGLSATSRAFIHESPDLKEYADHTSGDGAVPACVFSIFGNGLTTILNEYVAGKAKGSHHEVPAVMTSLWKKLDFTLNQIRSLQNSPAISACQRTRSRVGVANMARQRALAVATPGPPQAAPGQTPDVRLLAPRDSLPLAPEPRFNPGPMSPGRRKWDTPRKRGGAVGVASGPSRSCTATAGGGGISAEPPLEEVVDGNFPRLVIRNAREKMLGDRALQEKLAENINKILASDPVPQTSRSAAAALEADQSIDEILGLEGEIHMSDDAIHDILEQTESDPAFRALFDLFDCGERGPAGCQAPGRVRPILDGAGFPEAGAGDGEPPAPAGPPQRAAPGDTSGVGALDATLSREEEEEEEQRGLMKTSTLLKKTLLRPGGRSSRIENSSARLLVSPGEAALARPPLSTPPAPPPPSSCSSALPPPPRPGSAPSAGPASSAPPASSACAAEPGVVSLKIIISEDKEEDPDAGGAAPSGAVSGEKIPTIYLSSPAKCPGGGSPDEAAQAVSGLQRSEGQASPLRSGPGSALASPLAGAQNYILLLTEPARGEAPPRQVLLPAGVAQGPPAFSPYAAPAQASAPGYPAGSTLLPAMAPASVTGQNAAGPVQMVSSQFVTVQNAVALSGTSSSSAPSLGSSAPGAEPEDRGQQRAPAGPKHKRALCFEPSAEGPPRSPSAGRPAPGPRPQRDGAPAARTRPNILGGNRASSRPQRAVERNLEEEAAAPGTRSAPAEQGGTGERPGPGPGPASERRCQPAPREDRGSSGRKEAAGRLEARAPLQEAPSPVTGKEEAGPLPKTPRTPSKTSSLAKQAAEMLHDLQGHRPPPQPPRADQEEPAAGPGTPGRQRKAKDGEGTPKPPPPPPPSTPEVPSCSPVSEAGSESSINMAAHTLMILSRATIARTGAPPKGRLPGETTPAKGPAKTCRKRKPSSPAETPPAKKDAREKKKLMDFFPRNLDVDKFLSSLHYDE